MSSDEIRDLVSQMAPTIELHDNTLNLLFDEFKASHERARQSLAMHNANMDDLSVRTERLYELFVTIVKTNGVEAARERFHAAPGTIAEDVLLSWFEQYEKAGRDELAEDTLDADAARKIVEKQKKKAVEKKTETIVEKKADETKTPKRRTVETPTASTSKEKEKETRKKARTSAVVPKDGEPLAAPKSVAPEPENRALIITISLFMRLRVIQVTAILMRTHNHQPFAIRLSDLMVEVTAQTGLEGFGSMWPVQAPVVSSQRSELQTNSPISDPLPHFIANCCPQRPYKMRPKIPHKTVRSHFEPYTFLSAQYPHSFALASPLEPNMAPAPNFFAIPESIMAKFVQEHHDLIEDVAYTFSSFKSQYIDPNNPRLATRTLIESINKFHPLFDLDNIQFLARNTENQAALHDAENKINQVVGTTITKNPTFLPPMEVGAFKNNCAVFYGIPAIPVPAELKPNTDDLDAYLDAPSDAKGEPDVNVVLEQDEPMEEARVCTCTVNHYPRLPCQALSPDASEPPAKKTKSNKETPIMKNKNVIPDSGAPRHVPAEHVPGPAGTNTTVGSLFRIAAGITEVISRNEGGVSISNNQAISLEDEQYNNLIIGVQRLSYAVEDFVITRTRHNHALNELKKRGVKPPTRMSDTNLGLPVHLVQAINAAGATNSGNSTGHGANTPTAPRASSSRPYNNKKRY
ncbi:hypothetical protein C8F01DRAFT_1089740 [Mycena amicta]|nr:hypothetical protein C8F01DRAFT_1089740 [Mycena amicta]